jgi:hypothetical protein
MQLQKKAQGRQEGPWGSVLYVVHSVWHGFGVLTGSQGAAEWVSWEAGTESFRAVGVFAGASQVRTTLRGEKPRAKAGGLQNLGTR